MEKAIIYEQPLNEIIRTCLRLEHVFQRAEHFLGHSTSWDYRAAMRSLTEAMSILDRPDFKGKAKQELIRFKSSLKDLHDHQHVDSSLLTNFIDNIQTNIEYLDQYNGKLGDELRNNDFLTSIRHNLQKAGGTCDFETPNYHYWLQQDSIDQKQELEHWFEELMPVKDLIELMLNSIRQSTHFEKVVANAGSYQQALEANQPYQLIRIAISKDIEVFPEISVGRQRYSICFRKPSTETHSEQVKHDVKFEIACCKL